ncbi:MAG: hypothetical protein KatS3mg060_3091 [Dehalococcoidia bacterium]|nr:MAG: hypothetical protein KatS3mg060_3091 [Dehalococcoidia bacterium]
MGLFDRLRRRRPPADAEEDDAAPLAVQDVDPAAAQALQADGAIIVDVRHRHEYDSCHIPGAHLLPVDEIRRDVSLLPIGKPLVFVCEMGGRSAYAAALAAAAGRSDVFNLDGGMQAWLAAGLPTEP